MHDLKLQEMEPGLVKIVYPFFGKSHEELALKLDSSIFYNLDLPNGILCYRPFLIRNMIYSFSDGARIIGPFSGRKVRDEYIENVNRRVIQLTPSFCDFKNNHLLIPRNGLDFEISLHSLNKAFFKEGLKILILSSRWDNYKIWETKKLKTF